MADHADEPAQLARVLQGAMQRRATTLRRAAQEDPRGVAVEQRDLPVENPENAVPRRAQGVGVELILPLALEVRLVIIPSVLLAPAVDCDRYGLGRGQRDLKAQIRQFCLAEEIMRLVIRIAGALQAELVQVHQRVLVLLPLRPQDGQAAGEVRILGACGRLAGTLAMKLVRVQRLPASQGVGILLRALLPALGLLVRLFGSLALELALTLSQPLFQLLRGGPVLRDQRSAQGVMLGVQGL
mmetsp:Transcript_71457/g.218904  ORF Transcript_71457/g.218904 Transcript_71457/m.218904 type:complete len:241 (-) Transcript_71457:163-885(-)